MSAVLDSVWTILIVSGVSFFLGGLCMSLLVCASRRDEWR